MSLEQEPLEARKTINLVKIIPEGIFQPPEKS